MLTASCDKTCKLWDLQSNQTIAIAQHDAPIKSVHWVQSPNYQLAVTGSWDKTIKVGTLLRNHQIKIHQYILESDTPNLLLPKFPSIQYFARLSYTIVHMHSHFKGVCVCVVFLNVSLLFSTLKFLYSPNSILRGCVQ